MRLGAIVPCSFAFLLAAGLARAEEAPGDAATNYATKAKRRSDFTIGTGGAWGLGHASGYPNEIQKIGDSQYRSTTKLGLGSGGGAWLGVAFNDYLTFGLGFGVVNASGDGRKAGGGGFLFHVDLYPLFAVSPHLEDLGVFGNFGAGGLRITGGKEDANGGFVSYVEGGLSYEHFRFWRMACGPTLSVLHLWSESANLSGVLLGARLAFYGGP